MRRYLDQADQAPDPRDWQARPKRRINPWAVAVFVAGLFVYLAVYGAASFVGDLGLPFGYQFAAVVLLLTVAATTVYGLVDRALGPDPDLERPWDPRR